MNSENESPKTRVTALPILWNVILIALIGTGFAVFVLHLNVNYPASFGEAAWGFSGFVFGIYVTIVSLVGRLYFKQLGSPEDGD